VNIRLDFRDATKGNSLGSVVINPTAINLPNELWWIVNKIFPQGLFPYLDPSDTFEQLKGLPDLIHVNHFGPVRVFKSPA
jgi:hypothetical protein